MIIGRFIYQKYNKRIFLSTKDPRKRKKTSATKVQQLSKESPY